jgi:GNAT superfamily N-acetyltransferase
MEYEIENPADLYGTIQFLDERIYEYNSKTVRKADGSLFSRVIRNGDGRIIAGIAGWTWAGACEITILWVDEEHRKKKLGSLLLKAAEDVAAAQGCDAILLRSYEFQAPFFYRKQGYEIAHVLEDFPKPYKYYTLIKRLAGRAAT